MKSPEISIIIPIFNNEKYLYKCIDSIIKQSFKDIEIFLIDDGSTDNSLSICNEYKDKDARIKVIHKKNEGVSIARNTGILASTGKYLLFIDSDDFIAENSIVDIVNTAYENDADLVFLTAEKYFKNGKTEILEKGYNKEIIINGSSLEIMKHVTSLNKFPGSFCTKLVKREIILTNNIFFDENQSIGEDLNLVIKTIAAARSFNYCEKKYYYYRQSDYSTKYNAEKVLTELLYKVIKKWLENVEKPRYNDYTYSIYSLLAYEYYIILLEYGRLDIKLRRKYKNDIKSISWLMKYRNDYKNKAIKFVYKMFGLFLTSKILNIYMKIR
jgi:glycosyltransferase involved in cell wall biosynthesis